MYPKMTLDQPLDFSVKSPSSPGSDSYTSQTSSSRNKRSSSNGSIVKDEQYWQRREKNNMAAKRSRDARRQKEESIKMENKLLRETLNQQQNTIQTFKQHLERCPHAADIWDIGLDRELSGARCELRN